MADTLAIGGGVRVRNEPLPPRGLVGQEEKAAAMAVFDEGIESGNASGYGGKYEQQYEADFVKFMGGGYADAVNSGTNAVFCALGGLQLDALSEVIVPSITDPGGVMPVIFVGCVPVIADASLDSYNTSAEQIEPLITERTRAIVVAHIAGEPADMDPILALAKKHNLYVVEDCAQAHGAKYKGKPVGTLGHIAAFSTMFGKHHCTGGQGGVVYSTDETLFQQAKRFADRGKPFFLEGATGNVTAGLNCNLNDLAGAIGCEQLKKLPGIIARRQKTAQMIEKGLADCRVVRPGKKVPDAECVYWFLRVKLELDAITVDKKTFCDALSAEGIGVMVSYRCIPCESPWFKDKAAFGKSGFPWNCSDYQGPRDPEFKIDNAISVTDTHFNFMMHESYGDREVADILAAVKKVEAAYLK